MPDLGSLPPSGRELAEPSFVYKSVVTRNADGSFQTKITLHYQEGRFDGTEVNDSLILKDRTSVRSRGDKETWLESFKETGGTVDGRTVSVQEALEYHCPRNLWEELDASIGVERALLKMWDRLYEDPRTGNRFAPSASDG
ncbi:hypothetical protein IAR55_004636 [Kwoniella newhampshirensis]|uniref:Uncharacterized protein n=1 Tax=Kwoniella newhampshirensis TaxID=1651941 RepID=A0AAW0YKQ0_9TREE